LRRLIAAAAAKSVTTAMMIKGKDMVKALKQNWSAVVVEDPAAAS